MTLSNPKIFLIFLIIFIICCGIISINKTVLASPDPPQNQEQSTPQENFTPEIDYPTPFGQEPTKSLPDYVSYIYKFAIWSSGFLAMLMLVVGGIKLIGSGGSPQALSKAREQILNSIIGLGVVLLSASILNLLNPELLVLKEASIKDYTPQKSLDDIIKEWKEKNKPSSGTYNLYVGAVYDTGKKMDCYLTPEQGENAETEKSLITGDKTESCEGISGNQKDIYCLTSNYGSEDEAPENPEDVNSCTKICTINSSCTKVEGYIDTCELPATCAEIKAKGIKSDCNDNYIYCLTNQPPPPQESGGSGGGSGGGGGETGEIPGRVYVGCPCDHPLQGPPNNGYTCSEIDPTTGVEIVTKSGYCAEWEVCLGQYCYDVRGQGKCFCNNSDKTYKCLRYGTPEGINAIEIFKIGKCEDECSSPPISNGDRLPCRATGVQIPEGLEY